MTTTAIDPDAIPLVTPDTRIRLEQGEHGEAVVVIQLANLTPSRSTMTVASSPSTG